MDAELERRWKRGTAPFDGATLRIEELISLSLVRRALIVLAAVLEAEWPEVLLYLLHDWHEHDGVVLPPVRTCSWREVWEMLSSDDSLYAAGAGDTWVRIGLYPEDRGFYLRFYPENDEEEDTPPRPEHLGNFDLTCRPSLAEMAMARLVPLDLPGLRCEPAKAFFDARMARG